MTTKKFEAEIKQKFKKGWKRDLLLKIAKVQVNPGPKFDAVKWLRKNG